MIWCFTGRPSTFRTGGWEIWIMEYVVSKLIMEYVETW